MSHYVYKYVKNNEIIYIGKSDANLHARIKQHSKEEKFKSFLDSEIYYCTLANATMSDVVESELIRKYNPKLNVAKKNEWTGLNFEEPKWIKYEPSIKTRQFINNVTIEKTPTTKKIKHRKLNICISEELNELVKKEAILPSYINDFVIESITEKINKLEEAHYKRLHEEFRSLNDAIINEGYVIFSSEDGIKLIKRGDIL